GMSLFFALSGFLIVSGLRHNDDIFEFAVRRFARILPLAYLYLVIVSLLVHFDADAVFVTGTFLVNYLSQYMTINNGHFWSLCVEVHFYIALALVVLAAGKNGIWMVWPACLIITAMRMANGVYLDIETHLRVDEILVGACIATLYRPAWIGSL